MNTVWPGFLNPHYAACSDCAQCAGSGYSPIARFYHSEWYGYVAFDPRAMDSEPFPPDHPVILALAERNGGGERERLRLTDHFNGSWSHHLAQEDVDALVVANRLRDFTHRPRTPEQASALAASGGYWMEEPNEHHPTAAEVNEWSLRGFGHDAINCWVCIRARCERNGVPVECAACGGSGEQWSDEAERAAAEAWEPQEPPIGEGWQMWETVSEGSPISPVFETPEQLARYLANEYPEDGSEDAWLAMIHGPGWCPSGVSDARGFKVNAWSCLQDADPP